MPPCHDSATATHGSGPGIPLKRDEEIVESVGTIISTVTEIRLMSLPGLSSFGQLDQHFRLVNWNLKDARRGPLDILNDQAIPLKSLATLANTNITLMQEEYVITLVPLQRSLKAMGRALWS